MKYIKSYNESNSVSDNELYFELVDILQSKLFATKDLTGVIDSIFIYNIGKEENEEFFNSLKDLESIVEDITGKQLIFSSEEYVGTESGDVYDYIIKLK